MKTYEKPEIEVTDFEIPDVITTSSTEYDDEGFGPVVKL